MNTELTTSPNKNLIFEYVRRKRKGTMQPVGIIVATKISGDRVGIGWSLTATSKGDVFDPEKGATIALNRAIEGFNKTLPDSITEQFCRVRDRAVRYFKNCEVID